MSPVLAQTANDERDVFFPNFKAWIARPKANGKKVAERLARERNATVPNNCLFSFDHTTDINRQNPLAQQPSPQIQTSAVPRLRGSTAGFALPIGEDVCSVRFTCGSAHGSLMQSTCNFPTRASGKLESIDPVIGRSRSTWPSPKTRLAVC